MVSQVAGEVVPKGRTLCGHAVHGELAVRFGQVSFVADGGPLLGGEHRVGDLIGGLAGEVGPRLHRGGKRQGCT